MHTHPLAISHRFFLLPFAFWVACAATTPKAPSFDDGGSKDRASSPPDQGTSLDLKTSGAGGAGGGPTVSGGAAATGGMARSGGEVATGGTTIPDAATATGGATYLDASHAKDAFDAPDTGQDGPPENALSPIFEPKQGALLGAFVGSGTFDQLETMLGRKLPLVHNFFGWSDDWVARAGRDLNAGKIPLITWETWQGNAGVPLDDILAGKHEALIRARADGAKALGKKFFLRWGHEMNSNWYPWGGANNGANAAAGTKYIATYRYIYEIFKAAGATNVVWVFCPNVDSVPNEPWNQWNNYYPGDAYVDWIGFDGYNWGTSQTTWASTWQGFPAITNRIYAGLAAKKKPIMIPEMASAEAGGDKAAWIASIVPALKASYPAIKAFLWFHMNKETDWRIDSSPMAKAAFVTLAQDLYFNP